jgi:hypothetical protein
MGNERVVVGISRRLVLVLDGGDWIRARVRDVHARGAKPDSRHRRGEHHEPAGLDVVAIGDGPPQVAAAELERLRRPHVGDRVGPLVGRPVIRRVGTLAGVEWL